MGLAKLMGRHGRDDVSSSHVKPPTEDVSPSSDKVESKPDAAKLHNAPSDAELLQRAREAHSSVDFNLLAADPEPNGDWRRVESADEFVVFKRLASASNNETPRRGIEVMCAGRIDASLEEIASILRSSSEAEHNTVMMGLYAKSFIFGSYEREVVCSETQNQNQDFDDDDDADASEQLAVKTKSFSRTKIFAHNEQWCYFDYYQRNEESHSFTIYKRALPASETTPGRIGENARVDQLHGLNASYLVEKIPNQKELRVVFHAWFELSDQDIQTLSTKKRKGSRRKSQESASASSKSASANDYGDTTKPRAQLRRLLAMAHGVTKLPDLVRRRRYGVQVPVDLNAVHTSNSRCPCCTRKLAAVKNALASIFVKTNTSRCYLCGYLVCMDCWTAEHMECSVGRVAAIVVCTRCQANVQACEYSEVFAGTSAQREKHRGAPRVVESSDNSCTASLLVDFLTTSLMSSSAGSPEHDAMMAVIRTLLRTQDDSEDEDDESDSDSGREPRFEVLGETEAVKKVGDLLSDEQQLPALEACKLGNGEQRNYALDLPDDPTADVPRSPIPSNEIDRLATAKTTGFLQLANCLAPETPSTDQSDSNSKKPDTKDLELLCRLAIITLGCSYSFVTIMGSKHEHILAGTHPGFVGAAVPREQTTCQHALMSPHPFMIAHHEADVRFHNQGAVNQLPVRFYIGFPVMVPRVGGGPGDPELTVGMLCCIDSKPRAEITRVQYATMSRLASTAKSFLLQKSQQLQLENAAPS